MAWKWQDRIEAEEEAASLYTWLWVLMQWSGLSPHSKMVVGLSPSSSVWVYSHSLTIFNVWWFARWLMKLWPLNTRLLSGTGLYFACGFSDCVCCALTYWIQGRMLNAWCVIEFWGKSKLLWSPCGNVERLHAGRNEETKTENGRHLSNDSTDSVFNAELSSTGPLFSQTISWPMINTVRRSGEASIPSNRQPLPRKPQLQLPYNYQNITCTRKFGLSVHVRGTN